MSGRAENFVNSLGSENGARRGKLAPGELLARLRLLATDQSHQSIARRVAGAAFMMRAASAALVYVSQVLFARWMGKFEFGVYVYVWTWLLLAGSFMPLGLSSTAQRFIPEYSARGEWGLLRGFLVASRAIPIALGFAALALSAFLLWAIGDPGSGIR